MRFDFESLDATGNPAVIFRGIVGSRAVGGVRAARPAAEAEYSREKEQKSQLGNQIKGMKTMDKQNVKINIGCGSRLYTGYINVDVCGMPDVRHDLSIFPWPFADSSADEILAEHFLEHALDFERTIYEIYRILKPGGILHFKVPHFRSAFYPWHLHHYQFSTITCILLCDNIPYQFGGAQLFKMESMRLNYGLKRVFKAIFSFLANISPVKWDWLGLPIEEIECVVRKV